MQVIIGSTEKMGVGTNIQARAVALHHIDAPWRPSDVTQREGRLVRQGNQNKDVRIMRYATEGSFDAYMWGTLSRKAQFIEQVLTGRLDVREIDNSSEMALQFAEMQAITIGDMRILDVANLRQETQKLNRQERGHARKLTSIQARRMMQEGVASSLKHDTDVMRTLLPKIVDTKGDLFNGRVVRRGFYDAPYVNDRETFGRTLRQFVADSHEKLPYFGSHNYSYPAALNGIVVVGGLEWDTQARWNPGAPHDPTIEFSAGRTHQALQFTMRYSRIVEGDLASLSRSFEQKAAGLPQNLQESEIALANTKQSVAELRELESEPWPKRAELDEKLQRLAAVIQELEAEVNAPAQDATPPADASVTQASTYGLAASSSSMSYGP